MYFKNIFTGWFADGNRRQLGGVNLTLFNIIGFILAVYQVWSVIWGKLDPLNQMAIHLSMILALTFLIYGYSKKTKNCHSKHIPTIIDYLCSFLAIAAGVYFTIHTEQIATRIPVMNPLTNTDVFFGTVFVLLSLEAARRTIGFPIALIVLLFFSYALWGHHLTGTWSHRELSIVEFLDDLAFGFNGLWGSPISVAASFVFMFMLFGSFLQKAGAGEFFFKLSAAIAGRSRGGNAKVMVLASAFFGTISGSPTANVVTVGSFTIPVSIKAGYLPSFAAAVEAAASTGGSILPPIMGSSAFLMAAITGLPYGTIALAATIPGVLYYLSLLSMIHFEAMRIDLPRTAKEDVPKMKQVLKEGWYYFIPLIVLVASLIQGYSPSRTGFYGILSIVLVSWFRKNTRMGLIQIFKAMVDGSKSSIQVTTACAAAGLVIAGIMSTGLGGKITSIVLSLTSGMLIPTLLLVMVICVILGMGMPVAAAYILTAMLAAPALIELGVSQMSAHLFIVYFSIFSAITPPVAVAAFAAAGIADANPNRVGFEAMRLGIVGFIVPFLFVIDPSLLMDGTPTEIIFSSITALFGVITLAAGVIGWLVIRTTIIERILLIAGGVMLIYPDLLISGIGIVCIILVLYFQQRRSSEKLNKELTPYSSTKSI